MLGLLQYSKGGFEHVAVFFFLLQDHSFLMQAGLQQTFQFLPQKEKKGVAGRLEPAADKTTSAASSIKDAARGNTPAADKESRPRFWHRVPAQEPAGASLSPIFLSAGSLCCRPPEFCTPSIFFCCSLLAGLLHDSRILQQSFLYLQHTRRVPAAGKAHSTAGKKKSVAEMSLLRESKNSKSGLLQISTANGLCSPSPASPAFPPPLHPAFLAVRGACRRPLPPPAPPLCRCSIMWSAAVRRAALVAARPGGWARPGAILYGTPAGGGVGGGLTRTRHPAGVTTVVAGGRRFQLAMTQDVAPRTSLTAHGVGFFVVGCGEGRRRQPPRGLSGASGGGVTCWFFV